MGLFNSNDEYKIKKVNEQLAQIESQIGISKGVEIRETDPTGDDLFEGRIWIVSVQNTEPVAPVISLVSTDETSVTFQLDTASTDTEDGTISTYEIYKDGVLYGTTTLSVGGQHTITGLSAGTTYSITIKGKDSGGLLSPTSNAISATTIIVPLIEWADDFNDSTIDANNFASVTTGAGEVTEDTAHLYTKTTTTTDVAFVYYTGSVNLEATQKYKVKVAQVSTATSAQPIMSIIRKSDLSAGANLSSDGFLLNAWVNNGAGKGTYISHCDSGGTWRFWDRINNIWTTSATNAYFMTDIPAETYFYFELETDKSNGLARINAYDQNNTLVTSCGWLDLSSIGVGNTGQAINVSLGDPVSSGSTTDLKFDSATYTEA